MLEQLFVTQIYISWNSSIRTLHKQSKQKHFQAIKQIFLYNVGMHVLIKCLTVYKCFLLNHLQSHGLRQLVMYYYNLTYTGRQLYCLPRQVPRESSLSRVDNLMFTSYEDNKSNSGIADTITKPDRRKNDIWYNSMFTL